MCTLLIDHNRLIELEPDNVNVIYNRGVCYDKLGLVDKVRMLSFSPAVHILTLFLPPFL